MASEKYIGPKFKVRPISTDIPSDSRIKELSRWCRIFHELGLAPPYDGGSYGNLSFRESPGRPKFIITAAKSSLADSTTNDRFVRVDMVDLDTENIFVRGMRLCSSESPVHAGIYYIRPDIRAIFHGHSSQISKNAKRAGAAVTDKYEPYGTIELVRSAQEKVEGHMFLELRDHGFLSFGKTLSEAGNRALDYLRRCS